MRPTRLPMPSTRGVTSIHHDFSVHCTHENQPKELPEAQGGQRGGTLSTVRVPLCALLRQHLHTRRLYLQMSGPHGGQTTVIFDGNEKEHHEMADLRDKLAHKFPLGCWEASPTSKTSVAHRVVLAARHQ
jgi:hypothetical protein